MPRRFLAPSANRAVLAEPSFDAVPALIAANQQLLDRNDVRIGGMSLLEFRAQTRSEVLEVVKSPSVASGGLTPLLIAGHQPELSHPGVWVKNFALCGLAKKVGGIALNLIVDNDTLKHPSLRFPVFRNGDPASVRAQAVPFDQLDGETYEDRSVFDPELFRTFADRAAPLWRNWGYEPALRCAWEYVTRFGELHTNIGDLFAAVRQRFEYGWGCHNLELPVSRLSGTEAFARFAAHILADLPRFREAYNAAIRAYRAANGIRSEKHPAPELGADEAPFWVRSTLIRRERATASSDVRNLRPRALTLTLFARLVLGDFFIHGIGGGKYDEVTDTIIRDYFGIEPPGYQVLSATLHLPLPGFDATDEDLTQAQRAVRDLHWNPQRHVEPPALDDPQVLRLVADRIGLASNEPSEQEARREWFQRLQQLNEKLRTHLGEQVPLARTKLDRIAAEARANANLKRRDYSWVLYPEATLRPFLQRFLEM